VFPNVAVSARNLGLSLRDDFVVMWRGVFRCCRITFNSQTNLTWKLDDVAPMELRPGFCDGTINTAPLTELDFRIENSHGAIHEGTTVMTTAAATASERRRLIRSILLAAAYRTSSIWSRMITPSPGGTSKRQISNDKEPSVGPLSTPESSDHASLSRWTPGSNHGLVYLSLYPPFCVLPGGVTNPGCNGAGKISREQLREQKE
jgi:hypothetical protein